MFWGNVSMKYFGKYTQLFCPVPTSIKRGGSIPWKDYPRILKQYDDYMAEFPIQERSAFFRHVKDATAQCFYLCEYIPFNKGFHDLRSSEFVYSFEKNDHTIVDLVAYFLCQELMPGVALAAVPPSKVEKAGQSSVYRLISRVMELTGESLHLIDASSCLVRTKSIVSQHTVKGPRYLSDTMDSVQVKHPELIQGKNVLLLDDLTISGNSFFGCSEKLAPYVSHVACFAVGSRLHINDLFSNVRPAFLFDFTEWDSSWDTPQAVSFFQLLRTKKIPFCVVVSNEDVYTKLQQRFSISDSSMILAKHLDHGQDWLFLGLLAKCRMQVYEPFIYFVSNNLSHLEYSADLAFHAISFSQSRSASFVDFHFVSFDDFVYSLGDIVPASMQLWRLLASDREQQQISLHPYAVQFFSRYLTPRPLHDGEIYWTVFSQKLGIPSDVLAIHKDEILHLKYEYDAYRLYLRLSFPGKKDFTINELSKLYSSCELGIPVY